jgi:hypothetical protein
MMTDMSEQPTLEAEIERSRELAARLREALARKMAEAGTGLRRAVRERPGASIVAAVVAGFAVVVALRILLKAEPAETQTVRR